MDYNRDVKIIYSVLSVGIRWFWGPVINHRYQQHAVCLSRTGICWVFCDKFT